VSPAGVVDVDQTGTISLLSSTPAQATVTGVYTNNPLLSFNFVVDVLTNLNAGSKVDAKEFYIYPVPVENELNIYDLKVGDQINIFNLHGKLMQIIEANNSVMNIDAKDYASGIYSVVVNSNDKIIRKKIVKK
jgi:hypothetical protein